MKFTYTTVRCRSLLLAFLLFLGSSHYTFSQDSETLYTYRVQLEEQYRTKDILSLSTDDLNVSYRYVTENGIRFSSSVPLDILLLSQHFASLNIPVIAITGDKDAVPVFAMDKAGGNDCESAQLLCSNTSQSANSGGAGTQELNNNNNGCLGTEHQSSWYYLNVQTGGVLSLTINPDDNDDDYDFAIWGPFTAATANANCPPVNDPIRCSYSSASGSTGLMVPTNGQTSSFGCGFLWLSPCTGLITTTNNPVDNSEGTGGDKWVNALTVTANQIYILVVDNFSNSGQAYNMTFGGSAVLGCTPIVLPVELSEFKGFGMGNGNLLRWTTESENNSKYFSVEWSVDPLSNDWKTIDQVTAAGSSSTQLKYAVTHKSPELGKINYYRLVQTDMDGTPHVYDDRIVAIDNSVAARTPVHIVNLMGQEVSQDTPGLVIYQFEDGTTQKVLQ